MFLEGKSGGFWFAVRVLTCWYMYPAVFTCSEMPCVSVCMFSVPTWLFVLLPDSKSFVINYIFVSAI